MTGIPSARSVVVTGLSKAFDGPPVLRDIDLEVTAGELLALLGPSGCGKTTLLRLIAGLERPDVGTIALDADTVAGPGTWLAPEKRRVGMVFQDWALFPHLSVAKNVAYGVRRDPDASSRIADALAMVGLDGLDDRMPATLSGGQQQRVALARALAPRPSVLLLDEPFSNLDAALRIEVRTEVHRLLVELGITSVFVTHDQEEAFVVGDRVAVMHDGVIEQVDRPADVYTRPATRWIANFVGEVNFVTAAGGGDRVETPLGVIPLESAARGPVDVLIRPEQLVLDSGDDGVVELIEYYGHDAMVLVRLASGAHIRVRTAPDSRFGRGDPVAVRYCGGPTTAFAHE